MITDVCVPLDKMAQTISETKVALDGLRAEGIPAPIVGHTLDGNFHAFIMVDPEKPEVPNFSLTVFQYKQDD